MDAARALDGRLRAAFRLHVLARAFEAACVGWCAGACVAALALSTGAAPASPWHVFAAATLAAAAAAGAWILERAPRRARHLRALDQRLAFEGALVTAVDRPSGATRTRGALLEALSRRVLGATPARAWWRASLPATPLALVALIGGAAVLVAAREFAPAARPIESAWGDARAIAASAARDARRLAGAESAAAPGGASRTADLAQALESFANQRPEGDATKATAEAAAERLAESARAWLDSATAGAQGAHPAASRVDDERARAVDAVERFVRVLDRARGGTGSGPGTAGVGTSPGGAGTAGGRSGPEAGAALTSGLANGRMVPPRPNGSDPVAAPAPPVPVGVERGASATRWWPAEHDAVVERWVASRRPK